MANVQGNPGFGDVLRRAFAALLLSTSLAPGVASADAPAPREIDARVVIDELSNALAQGRRETADHLGRLGFAAQVDELRKLDGVPVHAFSSRTMVEGLYRRAEVQKSGEGTRFLAVLYNDAASRSAALATDADFEGLRKIPKQTLDLKRHPIVFAPPSAVSSLALRPPLSATLDKAVSKLAQHYSRRGLAQARFTVLKNFRKNGFDSRAFERVLAESKSSKEAWARLVHEGTPPPRPEQALREVMQHAMRGSAALSVDRDAHAIMENMSRSLPPELDRYVKAEDTLESRAAQAAEAAEVKQHGKTHPGNAASLVARMGDDVLPPDAFPPAPGPGPGPGPGPQKPGPGPRTSGPTPSHPSAAPNAEAKSFANRYSQYASETLRSRSPGGPATGTPRLYSTAIMSAKAGRGVSAGGEVQSDIALTPSRAVWLANKQDDRFGRLFVEFRGDSLENAPIGASRVLFADSFYGAVSALWGRHDAEARYHPGEILILMSMDPKSPVRTKALQALYARMLAPLPVSERRAAQQKIANLDKLAEKAANGDPNSLRDYRKLASEVDATIKTAMQKLDSEARRKILAASDKVESLRGIVTHPALVGRELAWSVARIDFWFAQLGELSREAAAMNGGGPIPQALLKFDVGRAETWQFFEFHSEVSLGQRNGRVVPLMVTSLVTEGHSPSSAAAARRSHFGIAMFGEKPGPKNIKAEGDLYRVDDLEVQVQPMLDWLATNHHDFMRLNDFSEAFSLLRWLNSRGVQVTVVDMDGQGPAIATPDRVHIGSGPGVAR